MKNNMMMSLIVLLGTAAPSYANDGSELPHLIRASIQNSIEAMQIVESQMKELDYTDANLAKQTLDLRINVAMERYYEKVNKEVLEPLAVALKKYNDFYVYYEQQVAKGNYVAILNTERSKFDNAIAPLKIKYKSLLKEVYQSVGILPCQKPENENGVDYSCASVNLTNLWSDKKPYQNYFLDISDWELVQFSRGNAWALDSDFDNKVFNFTNNAKVFKHCKSKICISKVGEYTQQWVNTLTTHLDKPLSITIPKANYKDETITFNGAPLVIIKYEVKDSYDDDHNSKPYTFIVFMNHWIKHYINYTNALSSFRDELPIFYNDNACFFDAMDTLVNSKPNLKTLCDDIQSLSVQHFGNDWRAHINFYRYKTEKEQLAFLNHYKLMYELLSLKKTNRFHSIRLPFGLSPIIYKANSENLEIEINDITKKLKTMEEQMFLYSTIRNCYGVFRVHKT